ncbi:MAG TPA: hypothetical protein VIJ14_08000 [Rhabdochlamydiaceae bacterium]
MLPYSFIGCGSYTNGATPISTTVMLNDKPDFFMVRDITNWGASIAGTYVAAPELESWWYSTMAPQSYRQTSQLAVVVANPNLQTNAGVTGGFQFINSAVPPTFASLADTAITNTTFVVSMANTGSIQVGDIVRIIAPTGMLQLGGLSAQVTAVTTNVSITLGYIATAVTAGLAIAAPATTGFILKFYRPLFYPKALQVLFIQNAVLPKVYFAEQNDFTPGEIVDFNIPVGYGMQQVSFLTGHPFGAARVLTVINTATESSITIDLDTSGFTPFVYPTSVNAFQASPPTCFPAGSGVVPLNGNPNVPASPPGTNLVDAFDNLNKYYMYLGFNVVGAANATMQWTAFKADFNALTNA